MTMTVSLSKSKNQRKEVGRYAASSFSYSPLSLRSSGIDFMLIFRLENARFAPEWRRCCSCLHIPRRIRLSIAACEHFESAILRRPSTNSSNCFASSLKVRERTNFSP